MTIKLIKESLTEIISSLILLALLLLIVGMVVSFFYKRVFKRKNSIVPISIMPAVLGIVFLVLYPFIYSVILAFSNMNLHHFKNPDFSVGIFSKNIIRIFTQNILKNVSFYTIFLRTSIWSVTQLFLQVILSLTLALCLELPIKFKSLFRGILILPWAIPEIISILIWKNEFHIQYGGVNQILSLVLNREVRISWFMEPFWNYLVMTNVHQWLGFPFLLIIIMGALQSVPKELFEAAEIEGASGWTVLIRIKLPMIKTVVSPALLLILTGNFVSFNIPFLMNPNALPTSDLIATALFRVAFVFSQYGFSAAFSLVLSLFLFLLSLIYIKKTNVLKGVLD